MEKRETIAWVDLLRIVACFMVVLGHCCDPFVGQLDTNPTEFLSGAFWGSLVRSSVPLFVMISGVLLLPVRMDMVTFYRKRMSRVLIPLILWSIVTPVLYYIYVNSGVEILNPNVAPDQYTMENTIAKITTFIFNFNYDLTPMWYLYMLVGIYLFIPIIGAWLAQASQKDIKRFLWIWGITLVLPYIQMFAPALGYMGNGGNMGLLGVCDWNPYGTFYYFSGFLGYLVMAHYLVRFPLTWSWGKTLGITTLLMALGFAITLVGFLLTQKYYPGNYAKLEIVWYFSGINVFMMTFAVFVLIQKIRIKSSPMMRKIAALTFGIYLCHFLIVQMGYDFVYSCIPVAPYFQIPIIAILSFLASMFVVWVLSKIPGLKIFVR